MRSVALASVSDLLKKAVGTAPHRLALVEDKTSLTYADLEALSIACARVFAELGIRRGDRVGLFLGNLISAPVSFLALARLGAIAVPLSARYRKDELKHAIATTEPRILVCQHDLAKHVPDGHEGLLLSVDELVDRAKENAGLPLPPVDTQPADPLAILFTSGTTGFPKGATWTHSGALHVAGFFSDGWELGEGASTILAAPWNHGIGIGQLLAMLACPGTLIVEAKFKASEFLDLMERHRCTYSALAPAMYHLCAMEPDFAQRDLRNWRVGGYGGAPMPESLLKTLSRTFPKLVLVSCYGATETCGVGVQSKAGDPTADVRAAGKVASFAEVTIRDETGKVLPVGEQGEIWFRSPTIVLGYWKNGAPVRDDSFVGDWWRTGDVGKLDANGNLFVLDRLKDMISRGGLKVFGAEVESALMQNERIRECAIVGVPDEVLGERVHAFIVPEGKPMTFAELREWAKERIADYKIPETMTLLTDPLPRNASGKILKSELKSRLTAKS